MSPQLRDLKPLISHYPTTPPRSDPSRPTPGTGWQGYVDQADQAMRMVKGLLVGKPEDAIDSSKDWMSWGQLGDKEGLSVPVPVPGERALGAFDAVMAALPVIGKAGRALEAGTEPFFSALRRSIMEKAPEVGLAEHFLNIARKGGKAEELEWTGLEKYLREKSGRRLSRDEILKYVDANAPELREKMIGAAQPQNISWKQVGNDLHSSDGNFRIEQIPQIGANPTYRIRQVIGHSERDLGTAASIDEAKSILSRQSIVTGQKPKFTQYTLPGGENHRELVVTMPPSPGMSFDDGFKEWYTQNTLNDVIENLDPHEIPSSWRGNEHMQLTPESFAELPPAVQRGYETDYRNALRDFTEEERGIPQTTYQAPQAHAYGDPELDVNRLFHARYTDRTTTEGETGLLLEELQSDWHQAGREARLDEVKRLMKSEGLSEKEAKARVPADFGYSGFMRNETLPEHLGMLKVEDEETAQMVRDTLGDQESPQIGDWVLMGRDRRGDEDFGEALHTLPGDLSEQEALNQFAREARSNIDDNWPAPEKDVGVPNAPFKTTWHELGMKRSLQEAAASGKDRLMWTTGQQQIDRYSLSHHVDRLRYDPETRQLFGHKDGRQVFTEYVDPEELHRWVGREPAEKLLSQKKQLITELPEGWRIEKTSWPAANDENIPGYIVYSPQGAESIMAESAAEAKADALVGLNEKRHAAEISGLDLEVGGEGMKGFYDKMLPEYANKLGKKYGVKAEKVEIVGQGYKENGKRLTENELATRVGQAQQWALEGMLEDAREISLEDLRDWAENSDQPASVMNNEQLLREAYADQQQEAIFNRSHEDYIDELVGMGFLEPATDEVWSIKITPEMRHDLTKKGQPLFAGTPIPTLPKDDKPKSKYQQLRMMKSHD